VNFLAPHLCDVVRTDSADLRGNYVRLDRNERASVINEDEYRALLQYLTPQVLCQYPDPKPLQDRLAEAEGLASGQALVTNGSDAAIRRLLHAALAPGNRVVIPNPTYEMYRVYARIFQAAAVLVDYDNNLDMNVEALCRAVRDSRAKIVVLVNPDQPTGHLYTADEVEQVVRTAAQSETLAIVDEAYFRPGCERATDLISSYGNIAVTRSYSKFFGFGGVRLGCLFGAPEIIDMAVRVKGLHEVNGVALAIGQALLNHPEIVLSYVKQLEEGRSLLSAFAQSHGFGFPECPATFQLLSVGSRYQPGELVDHLRERGFLIRGGYAHPALSRMLRVSLVGPDIMESFVCAFDDVLAAQRGAR